MEIIQFKPKQPESNPALVKMLSDLLEKAKQGEVKQLCAVANINGVWMSLSHGTMKASDCLAMSGMLDAAKDRIKGMIGWHIGKL